MKTEKRVTVTVSCMLAKKVNSACSTSSHSHQIFERKKEKCTSICVSSCVHWNVLSSFRSKVIIFSNYVPAFLSILILYFVTRKSQPFSVLALSSSHFCIRISYDHNKQKSSALGFFRLLAWHWLAEEFHFVKGYAQKVSNAKEQA